MKRTIALIVALLMCLGLFMGCSGDDTASTDSTSAGTSDGIFSTEDVKFTNDGDNAYTIIRPADDDNAAKKAAYIFKQAKEKIGVNMKNVDDKVDGSDAYEILIGNTNREESKQAREYLIANAGGRVNDFIICTIGKKIVINAMNDDGLQKACEHFVNNFIKAEGVKGGIKHLNVTQGNFAEASINGVKLGKFQFVKPRFNTGYIVQNGIEEANKLLTEKTGYALAIVEDHNAATEYEIIVGDAKRDGVADVTNTDEYTIKVSGKKVYLNGGSPAATAMAVSEFVKLLTSGAVTDQSSISGNYSQTINSYDKSTYYYPTWTDDFDAPADGHETGVDLTKWKWGTDTAPGHNGRTSVRSQSAEHLFVKDGMLNFYAAYDDANYYGFKLVTSGKMNFRYGILEMSAILPHGDAFWISLWANSLQNVDDVSPSAFFTEVNVVEMFGNSGSEASNLHGWLKSGQREVYNELWAPQGLAEHWSLDGKYSAYKKYSCPDGRFNNGLHTFTYIWDENTSKFACDGNVYFELDHNEQPHYKQTFTQPIYLILSQATCFASGAGRNMADDAPEWTTTNNFQIDYVHIYQKDDGQHLMNILE